MTIEGDGLSLARAISRGTLIEHLGIEFLEAEPGRVVARMPVEGNVQPDGLLHGGATAALCETIASFGTARAVGPDQRVVGIELNINHLRGVREGHVTGTGVPLHVGRSTAVWSMEVRDDEDRLVAVSRLTLAVRPATTE
ncbi:MAG: PaaI family thioesterase [Actinobacteria bacterium]|nr:MAG: PaaI family thioesterase [Actinomycetota bacterium]